MRKKYLLVLLAFALAMVGMAVIGGIRNYSPVPWWDMWDGTLQFYMDVEAGNHSVWWQQHNEHRPVLARQLFWLDYKIFGGLSVFLIASNFLLVGSAAYIFWRYLRESKEPASVSRIELALGLFVTAWLFMWSQENNLTWGFQVQFFLAQLLPLGGLLSLAMSARDGDNRGKFLIACIVGMLSVGTMANGLLALPLMALCAALLRLGSARICLLVVLAAMSCALYFLDYNSPAGHGTVLSAFREHPLGLLHYALLYVGSPFYFLLWHGDIGKVGALLAGMALMVGSAWLSYKVLAKPRNHPFTIALLLFILYVGGTALGAATGRFNFGVDGAVSSRYTTPAIMAWAAFFIALHIRFGDNVRAKVQKSIFSVMALLGLLMLVAQTEAVKPMHESLSTREIAALALALNINDQQYIPSVYPVSTHALEIAKSASALKLSIFGIYPWIDLAREIGKTANLSQTTPCVGQLDKIEPIDGVFDFVRVHGWIFNTTSERQPRLIRLVGSEGTVVGFALTGTPRGDVAAAIGKKAKLAGFRGYLLAESTNQAITAAGDQPACSIEISPAPTR